LTRIVTARAKPIGSKARAPELMFNQPNQGFFQSKTDFFDSIGHSRRFDDVCVMSAFPPIATL
jgi:hypothetical protein